MLYIYDDNISSMQLSEFSAIDRENTALIYSGLDSLSSKGRKHLKNIAQSLIALQNRPGSPLPDSIWREIIGHKNCYPEFGER